MKTNTRTLILVTVLISIILILLLLFINSSGKQKEMVSTDMNLTSGSLVIDTSAKDSAKQEANDPLSGRSVELQGFDNMVLKKGQKVLLKNSPDNDDFFVKYRIENDETGETVLETDLIPSGKSVEWIASDTLSAGSYTLSFGQYPYWKNPQTDEFQPLTGGRNVVEIEVID